MIETILSIIGKALWPIIAAAGGLVVIFFQRWKNKRLQGKLDYQDRVISTYEVKEEIHRQDQAINDTTDKQINDLRERVDHAKTPEAGAGKVSGAINDYFGGNK
jgi:hypothetical protein